MDLLSGMLKKGLDGESITPGEAELAMKLKGQDLLDMLSAAGQVARKHRGERINMCSITYAKSGRCSEDCGFCAQSAHYRTDIEAYPLLSKEQIAIAARRMDAQGVDRFGIVTSGRGICSDEEMETLKGAIKEIRRTTKIEMCASLGILSSERLKELKKAGLSRYHHNIETARSFYGSICSTHDYSAREETVRNARKAGLEVCCGGIIGMGETWQQRIEMAFALKGLDPDSIPINILNPIRGTPLGERPLTLPLDVLKTIALFRFNNPTKSLRYAGGREASMGDLHPLGIMYGLDGLMTGSYLTTDGRAPWQDRKMAKDLEEIFAGHKINPEAKARISQACQSNLSEPLG